MARPIVALLRAVNVGGHNRVPMVELRAGLSELGHPGARTYLQSGNVVLDTVDDSTEGRDAFTHELRGLLADRFGVDQPVIVRTDQELASVVARNPYPNQIDPTKVHVMFLVEAPGAEAVARLNARSSSPDEVTIDGTELFVHYPNGAGTSRLRLDLDVPGTARNWRTVNALLGMM